MRKDNSKEEWLLNVDCKTPARKKEDWKMLLFYHFSWFHVLPSTYTTVNSGASLVAQMAKNLHARRETWVQSLGWEDPLEKGMTTHSSILAWRIPSTEESNGLQSMGLQTVRQDWATNTFIFIHNYNFFATSLFSKLLKHLFWKAIKKLHLSRKHITY